MSRTDRAQTSQPPSRLYDLAPDPGEKVDRSAAEPGEVEAPAGLPETFRAGGHSRSGWKAAP